MVFMEIQQRVNAVNELIKFIASKGRKFFSNDGKVAELFVMNNKVYYKAEYGKAEYICLSVPDYRQPKGWFHGGTLLGLVKDFKLFIQKGKQADGTNGYGGLSCPHWGYTEADMQEIRNKAKELGYII